MRLRSIPFAVLAMTLGCSPGRQAAAPVPEAAEPAPDPTTMFHTGRITTAFASEGCPLLVTLDEDPEVHLIPIGLDERYAKNGTQLRFRYRPSRASNGGCMKGQPAVLEDITAALQPEKASSPLPDR